MSTTGILFMYHQWNYICGKHFVVNDSVISPCFFKPDFSVCDVWNLSCCVCCIVQRSLHPWLRFVWDPTHSLMIKVSVMYMSRILSTFRRVHCTGRCKNLLQFLYNCWERNRCLFRQLQLFGESCDLHLNLGREIFCKSRLPTVTMLQLSAPTLRLAAHRVVGSYFSIVPSLSFH